jgi:hypothetical protein
MWPRVRQFVINIHRRGKGFDKINLPFLFDFVKSLARAFDSFYNRNVVIVVSYDFQLLKSNLQNNVMTFYFNSLQVHHTISSRCLLEYIS